MSASYLTLFVGFLLHQKKIQTSCPGQQGHLHTVLCSCLTLPRHGVYSCVSCFCSQTCWLFASFPLWCVHSETDSFLCQVRAYVPSSEWLFLAPSQLSLAAVPQSLLAFCVTQFVIVCLLSFCLYSPQFHERRDSLFTSIFQSTQQEWSLKIFE